MQVSQFLHDGDCLNAHDTPFPMIFLKGRQDGCIEDFSYLLMVFSLHDEEQPNVAFALDEERIEDIPAEDALNFWLAFYLINDLLELDSDLELEDIADL